jgi:hypothetical protein
VEPTSKRALSNSTSMLAGSIWCSNSTLITWSRTSSKPTSILVRSFFCSENLTKHQLKCLTTWQGSQPILSTRSLNRLLWTWTTITQGSFKKR